MPWSPLNYTEKVFGEFGRDTLISRNKLWKSIIKHTKLVREDTIIQLVKAYEKLDFITIDVNEGATVKLNWDEIDSFVLSEKQNK